MELVQTDLVRQLKDFRRRIEALERSPSLPTSSIGSGGLTVLDGGSVRLQGGSLMVTDTSGEQVDAQLDQDGLDAVSVTASTVEVSELASLAGLDLQGGNLRDGGDPPSQYSRTLTSFPVTSGSGWPESGVVLSAVDANRPAGLQLLMPDDPEADGLQVRGVASSSSWTDWTTFDLSGTTPPGGGGPTVDTWSSTWATSWRDAFGGDFRPNDPRQGEYNGYGNHRGLWGFDDADIRSTLSGRTVDKVRVRATRSSSGGVYAAQTPTWWTHDYANQPTSGGAPQVDGPSDDAGSWARGETAWATLQDRVGEDLRDGDARGIAIYTASTSPYMIFQPSVTLEITHS